MAAGVCWLRQIACALPVHGGAAAYNAAVPDSPSHVLTDAATAQVALIYPPSCDPTAPYLAVPMLTGFLRAHGVAVLPIDANIEAYDALLTETALSGLRDRLEARLRKLDRKSTLSHRDQLAYAALWHARGDAHAVPSFVEKSKQTLRDRSRFYDTDAYGLAVSTIDAAQRVISAAYHPLQLDFTAYRTPFAMTSPAEIAHDSEPANDPFSTYTQQILIPRLRAAAPAVIGLSVCFPGQLQPTYSLARAIKAALPQVHLTVGGPAMTQLLIRQSGPGGQPSERMAQALGPFDSAVVYEGEHTLLRLVEAVLAAQAQGRDGGAGALPALREIANLVVRTDDGLAGYRSGHGMEDLKALPAPDFDGMPLSLYLSPQLVLPYDPTRGCYWGKCTFCHYGLAEVGTAAYRERAVPQMIEHLRALSSRYGTDFFYLSQDSVAPKTLLRFAEGVLEAGLKIRWATDLKPERYLHAERAETLRKAGAVACALGVESAAPRVLKLIDKGAPIEAVRDVIHNLSSADIAAEAMCFTDFPTETCAEALATVRFLEDLKDDVAIYIVGEFDLTHGALVAQRPADFGLRDVYQLDGDLFGTGLFFEEARASKKPREQERIDTALSRLGRMWRLRTYPWAGAVSTAHTLLHYARFGKQVFRIQAQQPAVELSAPPRLATAQFDLEECEAAMEREGEIWFTLVRERRHVSRAAYQALAAQQPVLLPKPSRYAFAPGTAPLRQVRGRRPSHAPNQALGR